MVTNEEGSVLRRNRKHLRPTGESSIGYEIQRGDNYCPEVCGPGKYAKADDRAKEESTSSDPVVEATGNVSAVEEPGRSSRRNKESTGQDLVLQDTGNHPAHELRRSSRRNKGKPPERFSL